MQKTKIFDVLKTFSKEDHRKFRQFINSDYFNTSIMVRNLYACIIKNNGEFSGDKLANEKLFEELYPGKKYREGTILTLLSRLFKLSEDFIAQAAYETELFTREKYLLQGLAKRKLDRFVLKNYEAAINEINKTITRDVDYFQRLHDLEYQYISFLSANDRVLNLDSAAIQNYNDKLIEYFIIKLLSVYTFTLNQKVYVNEENFDMPFLEYLIKYIEGNSFDNVPEILIYFNLLMLIKDDDEKYFYRLKELLSDNPDIISGNERRNLYVSMLNFCIFKSRVSGIAKFSRETFELLKYIIGNKIYITEYNTEIDHLLYLNTVMSGLDVKEFEWIENFIIQRKDEMVIDRRENTFNLCYALFYFSKKEYGKSLEYLNKVQRKTTFFNLQINTLTLQNYYELNLFENAFTFIDAYKHYLKDNTEITTFNKARTKDFLDVVHKLLKIKCNKDKFEAPVFDLSGDEFKNILKKKWIIEKIEEIQKI
jgi:hypothetical protein